MSTSTDKSFMQGESPTVAVKRVHLISSDNQKFVVDESVASQALTLKDSFEDVILDKNLPLPNITGTILSKVIEFCEHHVEINNKASDGDPVPEDEILEWNREFVKVDQKTLFSLIMAANYLNIKNLLAVTCQEVADIIRGKSPEKVCKIFNITNDFTPEEEAEVRAENSWAFE